VPVDAMGLVSDPVALLETDQRTRCQEYRPAPADTLVQFVTPVFSNELFIKNYDQIGTYMFLNGS